MLSMFYCQLIAASLCFATSGLAMKFSEGLTRPLPSIVLGIVVLSGTAFQSFAMRQGSLSATYLLVLGLEAVVATVLGMVFFTDW